MLEPLRSFDVRFVVMVRRVDLLRPIVKIFDEEADAREYWRSAAIGAAVGTPIAGHLITSAQLYLAPTLGSKLDAGWMATGGDLRLLETSSPMLIAAPAATKRGTIDA